MSESTPEHPPESRSAAAEGDSSRDRRQSRLLAAMAGGGDDLFAQRLVAVAASLVIVIGLGVIVHQLADILKPLFIAFFLTYLVMPAHRFLVRNKLPLVVSYLAIGITLAVVMFGFGRIVYATAAEFRPKLPRYREKLESVQTYIDDFFGRMVRVAEQKAERIRPEALKVGDRTSREEHGETPPPVARSGSAPSGPPTEPAGDDTLSVRFTDLLTQERLMTFIRSTVGSFFGAIPFMFIVIVYLIFLIAESDSLQHRLVHGAGAARAADTLDLIAAVNRAIAAYIQVKTLVSFLVAALSTMILWLFGVDFFIIWGVLTFLLNFIPFIGSIFAAGSPSLLAFLQFDSPWMGVFVCLSLIGAQVLMAYGVEPRMAGRRLDLSPLVFLLALAFWASIWGLVGAILAIPLVVIIKIVLEHIEATRPLARLLSNNPAQPDAVT